MKMKEFVLAGLFLTGAPCVKAENNDFYRPDFEISTATDSVSGAVLDSLNGIDPIYEEVDSVKIFTLDYLRKVEHLKGVIEDSLEKARGEELLFWKEKNKALRAFLLSRSYTHFKVSFTQVVFRLSDLITTGGPERLEEARENLRKMKKSSAPYLVDMEKRFDSIKEGVL